MADPNKKKYRSLLKNRLSSSVSNVYIKQHYRLYKSRTCSFLEKKSVTASKVPNFVYY